MEHERNMFLFCEIHTSLCKPSMSLVRQIAFRRDSTSVLRHAAFRGFILERVPCADGLPRRAPQVLVLLRQYCQTSSPTPLPSLRRWEETLNHAASQIRSFSGASFSIRGTMTAILHPNYAPNAKLSNPSRCSRGATTAASRSG